MTDKYTDFVNRNKPGYRSDMRRLTTAMVDDVVEFADAHQVDRETALLEVGNILRLLPCYVDFADYAATAGTGSTGGEEETTHETH